MGKKRKPKNPGRKNTLAYNILGIFGKNPYRGFNYKQVAHLLGIKDQASKDLINKILIDLKENSDILEIRPGKFKLNPERLSQFANKGSFITGKVDMKQTGKAYVISDEGGEDILIAPNNTNRAFNGDKVKVLLFPQRKGKKPEGQVVKIIQRAKKQFVGIMEITSGYAYLIPDNKTIPVVIFIPLNKLAGAQNGQKVIGIITKWPENSKTPFGEVVQVLGKPGDHHVEMESILAECDFPLAFPKAAEKEADAIPGLIPASEIKNRREFRNVWTITVDPEDAKDYDDALSLRKLPSGNWEVGIHIADVSYYVQPGTQIDQEAFKRGTSVYLVDRVIPMLPEKLSNHVCSLRPEEDKLCFSAVFELTESARVVHEWYGRTLINSNRRFNYEEVQEIIETGHGEFCEEILQLNNLAVKLREERFKKGAINFKSQEVKFNLDDNGVPLSVSIKEQKESNRLIEDFMLLANRRVAERIGKTKNREKPKTFVYRIHDTPSPEKLSTFIQFVSRMGYNMNISSHQGLAKSFNALFTQISGKGEEHMIETIAIRTMAKAEYSTNNIGHYGLSFGYYTHFTSPIRRYPDLIVHRLLERYLHDQSSVNKQEYEEICVHSSDMERKAEAAERESVKYKQAEYMLDKIGQTFDGLISGVSKWGIYVEIIGNKCEGMIRLRDLGDDYYFLDEENYRVIGQQYGQVYKLGDQVQIMVKKIDLARKQMDFGLV